MAVFKAKVINFDEFKSGGLHEKHAVATLNLGNHLSIGLKTEETQENVSIWPVVGSSGYMLTSQSPLRQTKDGKALTFL